MNSPRTRRQYRAPREHATAIVDPPFDETGRLLSDNRALIQSYDCELQGRSLRDLAQSGRRDLIELATAFTGRYRQIDVAAAQGKNPAILLAGHQPQLFHCGVWFKNFALSRMGQSLDAVAINLLIDNDTVSRPVVQVPTGSLAEPRLASIPMDRTGRETPFEERTITDSSCTLAFADRAAEAVAPFVSEPLVHELWKPMPALIREESNLGRCLAQLRHQFESQAGLKTLELPLSHICQMESFHWFAAHLLAQLPRLHEIHNESLARYRKVNRLRSQTHPVPALSAVGDWLEAPFWLWTVDQPHRRPVYVRSVHDGIELSDRHDVCFRLEVTDDLPADRAVEQLVENQNMGIRLRPRALITTMFSRMVLSDIFLHGIGGAKYDELTDQIIERFFQLPPPGFMTLSATMVLPVARPDCSPADLTQIDCQLRDLTYHPEKHLRQSCRQDPEIAAQIAEKKQWITTQAPRGRRRQRHLEIDRINTSLQRCVEEKRCQLLQNKDKIRSDLRRLAILGSREYSFCLFEKDSLVSVLLELLNREP